MSDCYNLSVRLVSMVKQWMANMQYLTNDIGMTLFCFCLGAFLSGLSLPSRALAVVESCAARASPGGWHHAHSSIWRLRPSQAVSVITGSCLVVGLLVLVYSIVTGSTLSDVLALSCISSHRELCGNS
eukprot:1298873-Amphidinium_carterae.1